MSKKAKKKNRRKRGEPKAKKMSASQISALKNRLCTDGPSLNPSPFPTRAKNQPFGRPGGGGGSSQPQPAGPGPRASLSISPTAKIRTFSTSPFAPNAEVWLMVGEDLTVFDAVETLPGDYGLVVEAGYDALPGLEFDVSRGQLLKLRDLARSFEAQYRLRPRRFDPGLGSARGF